MVLTLVFKNRLFSSPCLPTMKFGGREVEIRIEVTGSLEMRLGSLEMRLDRTVTYKIK